MKLNLATAITLAFITLYQPTASAAGGDSSDNVRKIKIDLSVEDPEITLNSLDSTSLKVQIINMLPYRRGEYSVVSNKATVQPEPFSSAYDTTKGTKKSNDGKIGQNKKNHTKGNKNDLRCRNDELITTIEKVKAATDETADGYPDLLAKLKLEAEKTKDGKKSMAILCREEIAEARHLFNKSRMELSLSVNKGESVSVSVKRGKDVDRAFKYTVKPTQWMTHVGFSFIRNQDELFYSKETTDTDNNTTYSLEKQENIADWKHAATVLFTYPMWNQGGSIEWGLTAGLGASAENLMVLGGVSAIIGKNFLINTGVTITQFDKLKGIYTDKQNIGDKALDTSALSENVYDHAFVITFGYKFGE